MAYGWRLLAAVNLGAVLLFLAAQGQGSGVQLCTRMCGETGCAGTSCPPSCRHLGNGSAMVDRVPGYRKWTGWVCGVECRYHCLLNSEAEAAGLGPEAVGYRPDWCLVRVIADSSDSKELYTRMIKSPRSDPLMVVNSKSRNLLLAGLLVPAKGLWEFRSQLRRLPKRPGGGGPLYPFAGLWTLYGCLEWTHWLVLDIAGLRGSALDLHLASAAEVMLAAYSFMFAILRVGDIRSEQGRVIVMALSQGFLVPHLLYMHICTLDYGLNAQICALLDAAQCALWVAWAVRADSPHPRRTDLLGMAALTLVAPALRLYNDDLWTLAVTVASVLRWRFARSDAEHLTQAILARRRQNHRAGENDRVGGGESRDSQ